MQEHAFRFLRKYSKERNYCMREKPLPLAARILYLFFGDIKVVGLAQKRLVSFDKLNADTCFGMSLI